MLYLQHFIRHKCQVLQMYDLLLYRSMKQE